MGAFWKLAIRNLLRHKRRNFLTGFMIAIGALTVLLTFTFSRTVEQVMTDAAIQTYSGDIQIHAASSEKIDLFYPAPEEIPNIKETESALAIITKQPLVFAAAPRLRFGGLASIGANPPVEVEVTAIDPLREIKVTPKLQVTQGTYLKRPNGILLGKDKAKALHAKVGQEILLMTGNQSGNVNGYPLIVEGIVTHNSIGVFLDYMIYMNIATARRLLHLGADESFELAVALRKNAPEKKAIAAIQKSVSAKGYHFRIESWKNVLPIIYGIEMTIQIMPQMMLVILLIVIAMGIINTVTMSVLERTREIGIMMALGTRSKQVLGLFVLEVGILSAISAGVGLLIGTGIILWLSRTGIPVTVEAMEFFTGGKRFYFIFNGLGLITAFFGIVLISIGAGYFPARTATSFKPIIALRRN